PAHPVIGVVCVEGCCTTHNLQERVDEVVEWVGEVAVGVDYERRLRHPLGGARQRAQECHGWSLGDQRECLCPAGQVTGNQLAFVLENNGHITDREPLEVSQQVIEKRATGEIEERGG